ncbi:MAG: patatin-like phospholipase family protein [Ahniella sp.]|jgi:NTE family protein|nr:patatin-like phospholipase family protein [Ahniella sp.]
MRQRRVLLAAVFLALTSTLAAPARAADPPLPTPGRPRIGLCLSGGGARGGAHVGVLRVLEELRIPVDYVCGTSIGSIIGGLYASGYSPQELDSVIVNVDWETIFQDAPPHQDLEYRRKEEERLPYFGIEIGVSRRRLRGASGMVAGQKLNFLLRRLTLSTTGVRSFDALPIPFRAVAVDLADGTMVVLDHGDIAEAMRASMAIPGAFTPFEIDDRLLVDGGLVRNLPYDVVRSMGADAVIGVDVGTPASELGKDPTFLNVAWRALDLSTKANAVVSRDQFTENDVLLVPDLAGVSMVSFPLMNLAANRGEAAARADIERLRRFSVGEDEYAAWRAAHRAGRRVADIRVADVRVTSVGRNDSRRVRRRVETRPGAPLDLDVLRDDLNRIYRLGEFELVDFHLEPRDDRAAADLVIAAHEKSWGPDYLRFGLSLADNFDGNASYRILLYHRRAALNSRGAEWRNQVSFGDLLAVESEFYQPLTYTGHWFIAPRLQFTRDKRRTFPVPGVGAVADGWIWQGACDLGRTFSIWGEMRLGLYRGHVTGDLPDVADWPRISEEVGGVEFQIAFDRLDRVVFPRSGWSASTGIRLSRTGLCADRTYDRGAARLRGAATTGRTTFLGICDAGTSFGSTLPQYDQFELGGFSRLSGFEPRELQGNDFALLVTGFYHEILRLAPPLGGSVFVGLLGEAGNTWLHPAYPSRHDLRFGAAAFIGAETFLGPAYLGYGWTEGGDDALSFCLGPVF